MKNMSCDIRSTTPARHIDVTHSLQPTTSQNKIFNSSLQNISNTDTPCPDFIHAPFPLSDSASWMATEAVRSVLSGEDSRSSTPLLPEKLPQGSEPFIKAEYTYQPEESAIAENPKITRNALKMTRYHDFIQGRLIHYEKELRQSDAYNISTYADDCQKIIQLHNEITQEVRDNASKAYQKQKILVSHAASDLNNMQLTTIIDEIAAICDPSKELANCYNQTRTTLHKACEDGTPYKLWDYLNENEPLLAWLEDSDFGRKILDELNTIPPESEDYVRFSTAQLQLINRILAFCKPITGVHLHALYQLDLSGKSAQEIIHTLIQNQGVKEILHGSFYGRRVWGRLMNCPLIIELFNHNKKIEHNRGKIAQQKNKLGELQSRSMISRLFNIWNIKRKEKKIKRMTYQMREDVNMRKDIVIGRDNYFKYLQNLSNGDVYNTLRELSRNDVTLQNNIDRVINLSETVEKVTPTFLFLDTKMVPFIHISRALTFCDLFTKNIGSSVETLAATIAQLYPASEEIRQFSRSLKSSSDEIPLIMASGYLLPPHIRGQERKRRMILLSKVISTREQEEIPRDHVKLPTYLARQGEWCPNWKDPLDDHTLAATVKVWLDNQRPRGQDDILMRIDSKLATCLAPATLERNYRASVQLNDKLVKKLTVTPEQQNIIKQYMVAYLLARGEYADPALRNARFELNLAKLLGRLPEKLAWDLEKVRLTAAHYREKKFTEENRLLTDKHLETIDHLMVLEKAIHNFMEARNALEELHGIYREIQDELNELESLYEHLEDIISGDIQRLSGFHQLVSDILNDNNIEFLSYFDADYYDRLNVIRKILLAYNGEGLQALFTTLDSTGLNLSDNDIQHVTTTIKNYLFDETSRETKSASMVFSLLFNTLFKNGYIVDLPARQTLGHAHEYLDALSSELLNEMNKIIEGEIERIMVDFPPAKPKNIDYINACCRLISQPEQHQTIFNFLTSQQPDTKKLSPREYSVLKTTLRTMLTSTPDEYQRICSEIICNLQQQRMDKDLYWLASMVYWHDFFSLRRAGYLAVNSDAQRKKEIEKIYRLNEYLFLDELATDYNNWREAVGVPAGKLGDFINEMDKKYKISPSLAYQVTLLKDDITIAMHKLSEEKRVAYRRAINEMNLRVGLAMHSHELEQQRLNYRREMWRRDAQNNYAKEIDISNKAIISEWRNKNHQHILENIALQRELAFAFQRERKAKTEGAITKTTRAVAHAWRNREVYVVIGTKIGHTSRVIIHDGAGPVNKHDTQDKDESTIQYSVVKVKASELTNDLLDLLSSAKPVHGAPKASASWRPNPGEAPTVNGRRLMKIKVEKTDEVGYQVFGVYNKYGDIPVKINQTPPGLDELMEKIKAEQLRNPGAGQHSAARDNAATPAAASQSTAAPSAENAMTLPQALPRPWGGQLPPDPKLPKSTGIPSQPGPSREDRPHKIGLFPCSAQMAHQVMSPRGWLGENAERLPYMISQTDLFRNTILVITKGNGEVIHAYDSITGDHFDKSKLLTTKRTIAAVRLEHEHYDAWLPDNRKQRHHFIPVPIARTVNGETRTGGTAYYLSTGKSSIHKVAKDGLCMTNAAALALDLNYGNITGDQLRSQVVQGLATGKFEALLQQPTFYDQTR